MIWRLRGAVRAWTIRSAHIVGLLVPVLLVISLVLLMLQLIIKQRCVARAKGSVMRFRSQVMISWLRGARAIAWVDSVFGVDVLLAVVPASAPTVLAECAVEVTAWPRVVRTPLLMAGGISLIL